MLSSCHLANACSRNGVWDFEFRTPVQCRLKVAVIASIHRFEGGSYDGQVFPRPRGSMTWAIGPGPPGQKKKKISL